MSMTTQAVAERLTRAADTLRAKATSGQGNKAERMPWPDSWWVAFDCADAYACRALWGEALRRLLIDALRDVAGLKPLDLYRGTTCQAGWVGSRDFHMMAALAGLDGVAMADRLAPVIKDPALAARVELRLRWQVAEPVAVGQPAARKTRRQPDPAMIERRAKVVAMAELGCSRRMISETLGITVDTIKSDIFHSKRNPQTGGTDDQDR